jgi:hypothetical protein
METRESLPHGSRLSTTLYNVCLGTFGRENMPSFDILNCDKELRCGWIDTFKISAHIVLIPRFIWAFFYYG